MGHYLTPLTTMLCYTPKPTEAINTRLIHIHLKERNRTNVTALAEQGILGMVLITQSTAYLREFMVR